MKKLNSELFGRLCYGYYRDASGTICLDEQEAAVVASIFRKYQEDYSLGGIVDWLHEQDIRSPSGKECWTRAAVDKLLSNKSCAPHILTIQEFMDIQVLKLDHSNMTHDDNWDRIRKMTRYCPTCLTNLHILDLRRMCGQADGVSVLIEEEHNAKRGFL